MDTFRRTPHLFSVTSFSIYFISFSHSTGRTKDLWHSTWTPSFLHSSVIPFFFSLIVYISQPSSMTMTWIAAMKWSKWYISLCRGADKSLARAGRKEANASVRMAWISFGASSCRKKQLDDSPRLNVVQIAPFPGMLPSLFPSWSV